MIIEVININKFFNVFRKHGCLELSSNIENKKQKYRKYNDSYLNFGLSSSVDRNNNIPSMSFYLSNSYRMYTSKLNKTPIKDRS